jgi:ribonucleoside-diphosphate reductase beta chain
MSLFSAFVMLLNYQRTGKMRGMCEIVEWSIRDETMHCEGMTNYSAHSVRNIHELLQMNLNQISIKWSETQLLWKTKLLILRMRWVTWKACQSEEVKLYIRYIADRRLIQLDLKVTTKSKRTRYHG